MESFNDHERREVGEPVRLKKKLYWTSWIIGTLCILLGIILAGVWWYHPKFIYHPIDYSHVPREHMAAFLATRTVAPREEIIYSEDGTKLVGYWFRHPEASRRPKKLTSMLYLHGNNGNIEDSFGAIEGWQRNMPVNVLFITYRGFGYSEGTPSMKGIQADSQAALDHLMKHPEVDPYRLILYGHSLGGSVALHLARANPTHFFAVFIENTFMSIKKIAGYKRPDLAWATMLITDKWDTEVELSELIKVARARKGRFPHLLFIVGDLDDVVPPEHMTAIWSQAQVLKGEKHIKVDRVNFPECRHTCYPQIDYFVKVSKFYYDVTGDVPLHTR